MKKACQDTNRRVRKYIKASWESKKFGKIRKKEKQPKNT